MRVINYEDIVTDPTTALHVAAELCGLSTSKQPIPVVGDDRNCAAPYRHFMTEMLATKLI